MRERSQLSLVSCLNETFLSECYIRIVINIYFRLNFCTQTLLLSITVCWVASDNFLINEHVCVCLRAPIINPPLAIARAA